MNFFNPSLKPDNQQFAQLVSEKRFKDLYNWHKQYTPWVSDALIVQYVEDYRQQVMAVDQQKKIEEEQKRQEEQLLKEAINIDQKSLQME